MRAVTVATGTPNSLRLDQVPEPSPDPTQLMVQTFAVGICGTDREIISGAYGWAPPGKERLVIGHESLGRVVSAPEDSGFAAGDLVVGIVRRPDPVPCPACASGNWDMCRNGRYTERGIKECDGYAAERFKLEPRFAVRVDSRLGICGVLLEPTSVVAKAWDQIDRIGSRSSFWRPKHVLVTGAGPIGLLAALIGVQRGYDVHVFDRARDGIKPRLVRDLGATYHAGTFDNLSPDVVVECTGATSVVLDAVGRTAPDGLVCLAGVSSGGHTMQFDIGKLNRSMVLENSVIFGTVNANRAHYEMAAQALTSAKSAWLERLISRRVGLSQWLEAYERRPDDVKVVLDFEA